MTKEIPKNCYLLLEFIRYEPHLDLYFSKKVVRNPGIRYVDLEEFKLNFDLKETSYYNNVYYSVSDALTLEEWNENHFQLEVFTIKDSILLHNLVYKDVKEITLCSSEDLKDIKNIYKKTYNFDNDLTVSNLITIINEFETELRSNFNIDTENVKFNGLKEIIPGIYTTYWCKL